MLTACAWLAREVEARAASGPGRRATVYEWERSTAAFAAVVGAMLDQAAVQVPRRGASGTVWEDMAA